MTKPIDVFVNRFEDFYKGRKGLKLQTGVWHTQAGDLNAEHQDFGDRVAIACALGAFYEAKSENQAWNEARTSGTAPEWLVNATPELFDTMKGPKTWARTIYGEGGALQRASKLPKQKRERLFQNVLKEVNKRMICNIKNKANREFAEDNYGPNELVLEGLDRQYHYQAAWTVSRVFDELLTKASV